jgi:serine/threonine protein kinase
MHDELSRPPDGQLQVNAANKLSAFQAIPAKQEPGEIPNFALVRIIGGGSYGQVWLARSLLGEYRAVKVVRRIHFRSDRPYEREFEGIRRFEPVSMLHPGLVDVLYAGEGEGFFYYVMELADDANAESALATAPPAHVQAVRFKPCIEPGTYKPKTLRWLLHEPTRSLGASECLEIAIALCDTVAYLHQCGLVHRDIKPSNVIFVNGQAKLADIGLVADADSECSFVGTEGYVAPEGPGKPQADVYALGMVLYEMLTGLEPKEYPRLPDDWADSLEREQFNELNQVVLKACEADPKRRYKTAEEMRSELGLLKRDKSVLRLRKLERLTRLLILALVVSTVALGWFLYVLQVAKTHATQQENRITQENLLSQIAHARIAGPRSGWVNRLAKRGNSHRTIEETTALLAGEDAQLVSSFPQLTGFSAAFSSDGRAVVSGTGTNRAVLIDATGHRTDLPVTGPGAVCWSPESVALHLGVNSNRLELREAETGRIRREFLLPERTGTADLDEPVLATTVDGEYVAVAWQGTLFVWNAQDGSSLGRKEAPHTALAFSPDGQLLAAGTAAGDTRVYGVAGLSEIAVLPPLREGVPIACVAFGADRSVPDDTEKPAQRWLVATADLGSTIVVWDLSRRLPISYCRGTPWAVAALAFHPDGVTLASAGRNNPRVWEVASGEPLLRLSEASSGLSRALAFDRKGHRLICGGEAGAGQASVDLWTFERHRGIHTLRGLDSPVRKVWFSPDSLRLAAFSDSRRLALWDVASDHLLFRFEAPACNLADQAGGCFDEGGSRFAMASGNFARLYDLEEGRILQRWQLPEGTANEMQQDTLGRWLLLRREPAPALDRDIWRLYELTEDEKPVLLHEQNGTNWSAYDVAFAPGGEKFLVWDNPAKSSATNVSLRAYAVSDGEVLWNHTTSRSDPELRVTFDPAGRLFGHSGHASGGLSLVRLCDFTAVKWLPQLPNAQYQAIAPSGSEFGGHGWYFPDLTGLLNGIRFVPNRLALSWVSAFSPDGKLLAQATEDGVVLVLDIRMVTEHLAELGGGARKKNAGSR